MKRVLLSIVIGVLFPIVYAAIVDLVGGLVLPAGFDTMHVDDTPLPSLLFAPVVLPIYIDHFLRTKGYFGLWSTFDNFWFRGTFYVLFNLGFYSILGYLVLKRLGWPRAKRPANELQSDAG